MFYSFDELFFIFRFHPSKVAEKAVTLSIRQQFGKPWPTWGAIPKEH